MDAREIKEFSEERLLQIPLVQIKMKEAQAQVTQYGKSLEARHGNLKLKKFVVIALGFERVVYSDQHDDS